MESETD
jgi:hypothetical protein